VDVFRPSKETPNIAEQAANIRAKTLWLQYGIQHEDAKKIATGANMNYFENLCIKQEYQRIFLKISPVFPVLKS
jgi:predicted CoA-binding protein